MEEVNVRYGVVNDEDRTAYEKQWQMKKGYDFVSTTKGNAINFCRNKGEGWIVEKIFHKPGEITNFKVVIFRGGKG